MYSLFNEGKRQEFIKSELNRKIFDFPDEISSAYASAYSWLLEKTNGIEDFIENGKFEYHYFNPTPENRESNWKNAGYELSRFLPNHTLKAYQIFLQIQEEMESRKDNSTLLDLPNLYIIDNGCGGGTVTIGLLCLVLNYQKYKIANRDPIFPVSINCLGLDPNLMVLDIYKKFLDECGYLLNEYSIEITPNILPKPLPDCLGEVTEWVSSQKRIHKLIIGLGNVVRPLTEEFEQTQGMISSFNIVSRFFGGFGSSIGSREASAVKALMSNSLIDQLIIPIVGSDVHTRAGKEKNIIQWDEQVKSLQASITKSLHNHSISTEKQKRVSIEVLGPPMSYYRKALNRHGAKQTTYASAFAIVEHESFLSDNDWQRILTEQNLILAWARVRNELSYFQVEDSVEIRLFELNIEERIRKLRQDILSYKWKSLNIADMFNFYSPKGENKDPRPLNLCRLEEQILAVAILQTKGRELLESHPRSYAYRLSKGSDGEFLYQNWYQAFLDYTNAVKLCATNHLDYMIIKTDIESYYTKIRQNVLQDELIHNSKIYNSRLRELIHMLLIRQFGWEENVGIPQGHSMSGFISNFYLRTVDEKFGSKNTFGFDVEYFRYVDDIIICCQPVYKDFVLRELDLSLDALGLTRSESKTIAMTAAEFLSYSEQDVRLSPLSGEYSKILGEVYKLNDRYYSYYLHNRWSFLYKYQSLLSNLGLFISIPRLSRKIDANSKNWLMRRSHPWRMVSFPYVSDIEALDNIESLVEQFKDKNNLWVERRQALMEQLQTMLRESIYVIDNSKDEKEISRAQIIIKFSSYRLGQLGFGGVLDDIYQILTRRPWLINIRAALQSLALQNQQNLLIKIYSEISSEKPEWQFVKASILKALNYLSTPSKETVDLLRAVIETERSEFEKTMASEALILNKFIENASINNPEENLVDYTNPYLFKNLIMVAHKYMIPVDFDPANQLSSDVVDEAIQFKEHNYSIDGLYLPEPNILKRYYADYPDSLSDFLEYP